MALYVEGRRALQLSEEERDRIADTLRLAEALGGEAVTLPASERRIADDVIGYAQANNVTQIVIGKSTRTRWFEILHGSVVHDLVRRSGNISVHVIAGDTIAGEPIPKKSVRAAKRDDAFDPRPYVFALVAVAVALGCAELQFNPGSASDNVDLVFPDGVVGVAVRFGLLALAVGKRRFFARLQLFLPAADLHLHHHRSDQCRRPSCLFTLVAVIVSSVAARGRTQALAATDRARTTESLYSFSRKLAGAGTLDDVLWATAYQTALMLKVRVVLLLPDDGSIAVKAGYPPEDILDDADLAAREVGVGEQPRRRPRLRYASRRQAAVPADAHRARRHRRHRHRQRQARSAAHARPAAAARRAARPGRARDRARAAGRGHGSRRARRRDRAAALGAAHLDLPRPEDAARRGARGGGHAARHSAASSATARRPTSWRRSSTNRSGSTASSPTCST